MAARYPYYLLADSADGVTKEAELTGRMPPPYKTEDDIKKGFVYRRMPHVKLKSIANNEEIDAIHAIRLTTSPVGSLTPTTTKVVSSFATPISPVRR